MKCKRCHAPMFGREHPSFTGKTAPNKVLQEVGPEDLRFRLQADDLAPALGVDGHGDYCATLMIRPPSRTLR
jgi:hypothetical protein